MHPQIQPAPADPARHRRTRRASRAIPLTAMIDVVFLLLIYFVLTASFAPGEGILTTKLPGQGPTAPVPPLEVNLSSFGAYEYRVGVTGFTQPPGSFTGLRDLLVSVQDDPGRGRTGVYAPTHPVNIRADGLVRWQHVVNAFNAAQAAGYHEISFAAAAGD